jgi:hypothetical protein
LVTSGGQEVMVSTSVVYTVEVVYTGLEVVAGESDEVAIGLDMVVE